VNIGLIGYGGVGKAFIDLLNEKNIKWKVRYILKSDGAIIDKEGLDLDEIKRFQDNIKLHKNWIDGAGFEDIIDIDIDFLVELTPTNMETGEPAISYIRESLKRGINIVTGNKGPILKDYRGLKRLAEKNKVNIGIGCTVGGALPSISGGLIDCAGANIESMEAILNGTTNYILDQMEEGEKTYEETLKEAQELGIAESNPTMDVKGYDTAIKMTILANVLMNENISLEEVQLECIDKVTVSDIKNARMRDCKIKLLGRIYKDNEKVKIQVGPEEIDKSHPLYSVEGKNKGIYYRTDTLGDITIIGGASGTMNAAASILRDIIFLNSQYVIGNTK
jgi:homoserine dehydrogenase